MRNKILMTLALLLTAATGAWAQTETLLTTITGAGSNTNPATSANVSYSTEGVATLTFSEPTLDGNVAYQASPAAAAWGWWGYDMTLTITPAEGYTITKCVFYDDKDRTATDSEAPFVVETTKDDKTPRVNGTPILADTSKGIKKIEVYGYVTPTAPSGPDVIINDTKTEASFKMPQYDATATYTIKRDISVDVTAQVGDGTQEQPRYRVKKDGNNKFIPADMEMAAVPALFTVNDAIEQKALTQTQDYIVQIYAIDAEGQPTGDPMTFATFTFEPGIYAVKAVAADGSDYAGETALSNTFKLFQGYEVQVAAKEFITYYKDEPLYADTETSADAELYTITSVSADKATLSAAIETAPSLTPLLIFNNSDEAKTFLLIPAEAEPNLALTVAPEFQGTLTGATIAASTEGTTNYAFNGKAFVFVKNDLPVAANKAWLSVSNSNARTINLVFDDATGLSEKGIVNSEKFATATWYDLNGRKLNGMPTKKGVYIMNGKKVVVK